MCELEGKDMSYTRLESWDSNSQRPLNTQKCSDKYKAQTVLVMKDNGVLVR